MMSAGGCLHVCRPAGSARPPDHLHAGRFVGMCWERVSRVSDNAGAGIGMGEGRLIGLRAG